VINEEYLYVLYYPVILLSQTRVVTFLGCKKVTATDDEKQNTKGSAKKTA
jgi:hypothetical protein